MRTSMLGLAALAALALAGPATAAPVTPNLLQDPGAEEGGAGWRFEQGFTTAAYGSPGFPGTDISASIGGGGRFFAGGSAASISTAQQLVDVHAAVAQIDGGGVRASLSGQLGGAGDQGDFSEVTAVFFVEDFSSQLGEVRIGPVRADERNHLTAFVPRSAEAKVPPYTRWILVTVTSTKATDDVSNDGYADNLDFVLQGASFTPAFITTQPSAISAKAKGRRVKGKVSAVSSCVAGRTVVITKGRKKLGHATTDAAGGYSIKTRRHAKGKLTAGVRKLERGSVICQAASAKVPGRH